MLLPAYQSKSNLHRHDQNTITFEASDHNFIFPKNNIAVSAYVQPIHIKDHKILIEINWALICKGPTLITGAIAIS